MVLSTNFAILYLPNSMSQLTLLKIFQIQHCIIDERELQYLNVGGELRSSAHNENDSLKQKTDEVMFAAFHGAYKGNKCLKLFSLLLSQTSLPMSHTSAIKSCHLRLSLQFQTHLGTYQEQVKELTFYLLMFSVFSSYKAQLVLQLSYSLRMKTKIIGFCCKMLIINSLSLYNK